MTNTKTLYLVGYASGLGATNQGCSQGPIIFQHSSYLTDLRNQGINTHWEPLLEPSDNKFSKMEKIIDLCQRLSKKINQLTLEKKFFTVIGGDHTCAIGTWSGVSQALGTNKPLGLIWIDAHMDSHTPETTPSGNIHGMPLACLLGYGKSELTQLLVSHPKLDPRYICLIGIRSYEPAELELLTRLKVRIFFMKEVKERGLEAVMLEAIQLVSQQTAGFGVSIDLDSIDPNEASGTGLHVPDGLSVNELCRTLQLVNNPKLVGIEIAEFDPTKDKNQQTEKIIANLITSITIGK
jgi:arginase